MSESERRMLRQPNRWLNNGRGWKMHDHEMKLAMDHDPCKHWPDEGLPWRLVGNVQVMVRPKMDHSGRNSAHRTMAECPMCMRILTAGKIHQHFRACPRLADELVYGEGGRR